MFKIIQPIFSILIGGLIIFFFVRPMYAEIGTVQLEGQKYKEAVQDAEQFNQLLDTLLSRYDNLTPSQRARLDALVPQEGLNEVKLVSDLEELALSHGLLFTSVTVGLSKEGEDGEGAPTEEVVAEPTPVVDDGMSDDMGMGEPLDTLSTSGVTSEQLRSKEIGFSVVGTYDEFRSFLTDVERSLVLMEVTKLTFAATEGDLMTFTVSVNVFSLPEK